MSNHIMISGLNKIFLANPNNLPNNITRPNTETTPPALQIPAGY